MISEKIRYIEFNSEWLSKEGNRLDGSFYLDKSRKAIIKIKEKGIKTEILGNWLEDVFLPNRFKRIYVEKLNCGIPFLTTSDVLKHDHSYVKILSKKTKNLENYILNKNEILVARSGTIGNVSLVYDDIEGFAGTEDLIRLVPKKTAQYGYIYAYLLSEVGSNLLKSGTFGSVVDHIEPEHVKNLPLVILDEKTIYKINLDIIKVFKLRTKANKILKQAEEDLYLYLNLPKLDDDDCKYLEGTSIKSWEISGFNKWFRFDANYYNTIANIAIQNIMNHNNKNWIKKLGDKQIVKEIINPPRSSRIYVNNKLGVPYYSGSNLSQFCKSGVKHLAKTHNQIQNVKVKKGTVLITRVGTTGRVFFVDELKDGICVSDNILRLIPGPNIIPEFLYVFLRSKYGEVQLNKIKTGAVQDYIPDEYVNDILIIVPDKSIQNKIATNVVQAFKLRNEAELIEIECKKHFDEIILDN